MISDDLYALVLRNNRNLCIISRPRWEALTRRQMGAVVGAMQRRGLEGADINPATWDQATTDRDGNLLRATPDTPDEDILYVKRHEGLDSCYNQAAMILLRDPTKIPDRDYDGIDYEGDFIVSYETEVEAEEHERNLVNRARYNARLVAAGKDPLPDDPKEPRTVEKRGLIDKLLGR